MTEITLTLTEPKSVQMGCNMAKLVLMGIGIRRCSQISLTEPTYVGPDRTALDDVTVQACAMG